MQRRAFLVPLLSLYFMMVLLHQSVVMVFADDVAAMMDAAPGQNTIKLTIMDIHMNRFKDAYSMTLTCLENMVSVKNTNGKYSADGKSIEFVFRTRPQPSDNAADGGVTTVLDCPRKEYEFQVEQVHNNWSEKATVS